MNTKTEINIGLPSSSHFLFQRKAVLFFNCLDYSWITVAIFGSPRSPRKGNDKQNKQKTKLLSIFLVLLAHSKN